MKTETIESDRVSKWRTATAGRRRRRGKELLLSMHPFSVVAKQVLLKDNPELSVFNLSLCFSVSLLSDYLCIYLSISLQSVCLSLSVPVEFSVCMEVSLSVREDGEQQLDLEFSLERKKISSSGEVLKKTYFSPFISLERSRPLSTDDTLLHVYVTVGYTYIQIRR